MDFKAYENWSLNETIENIINELNDAGIFTDRAISKYHY